MSIWTLVLLTIGGCYAFKLAGYLVPERVLGRPVVRKVVELLPVALLAALVVVEAVAAGGTGASTVPGWPGSRSAPSPPGAARRSS